MEKLLDDFTPHKELPQYERIYNEEIKLEGQASLKTEFEYAFCLIHSPFKTDIEKGINIFEDLASKHSDGKRDYIYYLAFANAKLKKYDDALKYCRAFLEIEPNDQVKLIEEYVQNKKNEAAKGVAVASGAALIIGGILGVAFALLRR